MAVADSNLIARVLVNGDHNAYSTLVRRYQSDVRALLRRLTKEDHALADDLAQETFIKAYHALKTFRAEAKLSTWLYRIAYNAFISHTRSHKSYASLEAMTEEYGDGAEEGVMQDDGTILAIEQRDLSRDLNAAMRHLSEDERAAIHICYQNGYSHSEAATVLGQPVGTVKTHIARGKEKLRQYLSAWQEEAAV